MRDRTWTPGDYPAAVTERGIFVLEPGNEELAQRFWELMLDGADLYVLLQELTSSFAAELAALPGFVAIIDEEEGAHIAVRGAFEVVVDGSEGPASLTGGTVITWSEHRIRAHSGWRIATPVVGVRSEEPQWRALSAVLPVSALASGTVGEVPPTAAPEEPERPPAPVPADDGAGDPVPPPPPLPPCGADAPAHGDDAPPVAEETGADTLVPWYERADNAPAPSLDEEPPPLPGPADGGVVDETGSADSSPYEYLYDDVTRTGSVEDAAVRQVRNSDLLDDDPVPPPPSPAPLSGPTPEAVEAPSPVLPDPFPPAAVAPMAPSAPAGPPPGGFFIDSVPGVSRGTSAKTAPPPSAPARPRADAPADGDHDGLTVLPTRSQELRDYARQITSTGPAPSASGPQVLAVLCEQGHPNATHAPACRVCSAPLTSTAVTVPRPDLGRIVLSTGEEVRLDRDIVIGRRPRSTPVAGRAAARMVIVPSPGKQISRSHCEVRIDDWDVRLHDLGSNNGTYLTRPGQPPVRLAESVPTVLEAGDVVDLGEGVSFRMEA